VQREIRNTQSTVGVLVTLLVRSYEQSERVYSAMRLRGFTGLYRTTVELRFTGRDLLKSFTLLAFCAFPIALELL
jgi:energy-coupling factor transporter transmembrane protein EcfT